LKDIADGIGISRGALSQNISGRVSLDRLEEIAKYLNVPVRDLFPDDNSIVCPKCGTRFNME